MRELVISILIIGLCFVAMIFYWKIKSTAPFQTTTITLGDQQINAEVANDKFKQSNGLMGRKSLAENAGMLFPMGYSDKHHIWMFNTYIPLDIIWIDENFKIVDIKKDIPPCTESLKSACTIYSPSTDAFYILEVNAGFCEKNNITLGQKATFAL